MFPERYRLKLKLQRQGGLFRQPPVIERREGKYLFCDGRRLLNFASNDYLGLAPQGGGQFFPLWKLIFIFAPGFGKFSAAQ